jgi:hypothetical protein
MNNEDLKKLLKEQIPQKDKIGYAPNESNEKNTGIPYSKVSSNKTGEGIEEQLDFGSLTTRDKKLIEEVINILKTNDNLTIKDVSDKIKEQFQISEIPMMKYEESLWHQLTKNENLGFSIQGYRETTENNKKIRIPHIAFSADLDYLDDVIKRLITTIRNLNIK